MEAVNPRLNPATTRLEPPRGQQRIHLLFRELLLRNNQVSLRKGMERAMELEEQPDTRGMKAGYKQEDFQGQINGKEIARVEWIREGRVVHLLTIRAKVDHCSYLIRTIYGDGVLGIKGY
ncbi:unnamed protein product (mitochondrion) [Musa hybrid cultivar]